MNQVPEAILEAIYPISFSSNQSGGMEKISISISLNQPVIPRFNRSEVLFLLDYNPILLP